MIALSPPRAVCDGIAASAAAAPTDDFIGFSGEDLLVDIDFDDLFVDFDDGDLLPDLELDCDSPLAAESPPSAAQGNDGSRRCEPEEVKRVRSELAVKEETPGEKGRKAAHVQQGKSSNGKKKGKVDWTPELHRKFVQAVEQLGLDKAVPSRILEVMGIDCLTRHNIASHLQKYRSHRKHMLARETEPTSWSHRRQAPSIAAKREPASPWSQQQPTMGFPPSLPPPAVQPFRPLHVWGHPTVGHAMVHMWPPKHMVPSRSPPPPLQGPPPPPIWPPPQQPLPQPDPSFWHHPQYPRGPNILTQGTPCFPPQPLAAPAVQRFPVPHFQSYSRQPMYTKLTEPDHLAFPSKQLQLDSHPSKESIDAALGDVLSKPWMPLPLGLKPPSVESVLGELQRQGVSSIPPSSV